ncbi:MULTISPECIES: dipeptidase [unclassified Bacillus (in: firmicutes)]|uniref:dipeptidase n=1 Tax=unclassified Bacillus (in: firmicutes) TaxID=185979 RepID=UPI0008EFBCCE|nr:MULTISPECIES: dipeptidase [unclassified Bacillus (in: firmicutes)]SFA88225.1 Acetylornithine deacetylase/Succinyl-diaminopimelate desuccinylase [Bacillus sp. UNCCL13]SFQ84545.1 Acetylornithine deacetylase/Succinyl-diaminopimelate desuccinylase [Bacillus sp. cl95]
MQESTKEYFKKNRQAHLDELFQWLSIPSISALPDHVNDMKSGADWAVNALKSAGIENVEVMPTKGHPAVYGEWLNAPGKPTVLIYGHYDVQPVDPVELWTSPPFEPEIRDEKLYARGASDDKGQVFMHIKAVEGILQTTGTLPLNFKFLIEGEEEIGSPNLPPFVEENKDKLAADVIVISDSSLLERGKPTICYGLRGLCGLQIDIKGASSDLHSGLYGGAVHNPIHALVKIVDSFHNEDGKVTVEGFYDDVLELTSDEKAAFEALNMDDEKLRKQLGVPALFGEKGFTPTERVWARPTLEINGIYGGFQGDGIKTVIPSEAHAKVTCRLVPNQDPDVIADLLKKHVQESLPKGVTVEVTLFDKGAPYVTPFDHPAIQAAGRAYEKVYGVPAAFTRGGGSIPIVAAFDQILKLPVVLMGFGLPDENFHAPDEHFNLENFDKGLLTLCEYWEELAGTL